MRLPHCIETERTVIRPFRPDDRDAFVAFMTDAETTSEFMFADHHKTAKGAPAFFDEIVASYTTQSPYFLYALSLQGSGGFVGVCGVSQLPGDGALECMVCLKPGSRGHGYATEAVRALIDHCFCEYPIEEFSAYISPRNHRSVAVARRLGMRYVGRGRHPIHGDESVVYRMRRGDWKEMIA